MKRLNFDILDENHDVAAYERHYTSSLRSTCQRKNSSPAISITWLQPWSRGQAFAYNWWNTPSELCDFHSQSRGRCWYFRTALETLSTQIRGTVISLPREREYWTLWSHNLTVDPRRIYLTHQDLTSWSQPYRYDKCTKQLYSVWILPVNYKRILNRDARRIGPSTTCWQLDSEARLGRSRSVFLNPFLTLRILVIIYP